MKNAKSEAPEAAPSNGTGATEFVLAGCANGWTRYEAPQGAGALRIVSGSRFCDSDVAGDGRIFIDALGRSLSDVIDPLCHWAEQNIRAVHAAQKRYDMAQDARQS